MVKIILGRIAEMRVRLGAVPLAFRKTKNCGPKAKVQL